ncbi:hypothetical protein WG908_15915 [Sphingobium sp. AN641]|uniref:hypothetical protein n=1 Tax=Sphingobium sp. AN641 TaxID=3133443 RepID=UPI0030C20CAC
MALAGALVLAGCNSAPEPSPEPATDFAAEQAAALLNAQRTCITTTLNETVYSTSATVDALFQRDLSNCPNEFVGAFVNLRTAARALAQTQQEIASHQDMGGAVLTVDAANVLCSLWQREQCMPFITDDWEVENEGLRERLKAQQAVVQANLTAVESASGKYGVYVRESAPAAPSENAIGNAM